MLFIPWFNQILYVLRASSTLKGAFADRVLGHQLIILLILEVLGCGERLIKQSHRCQVAILHKCWLWLLVQQFMRLLRQFFITVLSDRQWRQWDCIRIEVVKCHSSITSFMHRDLFSFDHQGRVNYKRLRLARSVFLRPQEMLLVKLKTRFVEMALCLVVQTVLRGLILPETSSPWLE